MVIGFVDPTCLGGTGGGSRADVILPFVEAHVDLLDPPADTDEGDGAVVARDHRGCRTAPGSSGLWALVLACLGRARPTRGRSSAP